MTVTSELKDTVCVASVTFLCKTRRFRLSGKLSGRFQIWSPVKGKVSRNLLRLFCSVYWARFFSCKQQKLSGNLSAGHRAHWGWKEKQSAWVLQRRGPRTMLGTWVAGLKCCLWGFTNHQSLTFFGLVSLYSSFETSGWTGSNWPSHGYSTHSLGRGAQGAWINWPPKTMQWGVGREKRRTTPPQKVCCYPKRGA